MKGVAVGRRRTLGGKRMAQAGYYAVCWLKRDFMLRITQHRVGVRSGGEEAEVTEVETKVPKEKRKDTASRS